MNLFDFQDIEQAKPLVRIGDLALVRFQKQPEKKTEKTKRGITNERQAILKEIVDTINQERKEESYPKMLTGRSLAVRLSHIPTEDLYFMLSEARDYKKRVKGGSIGKYIFGSIKVKNKS